MGRFKAGEEDRYGNSGGGSYFSLKNDGDIARVRFMYNSIEDVEGYAVHEVEINGVKRYVNCLRDYDDPINDCPFCRERKKQIVKLFIPLYDIENDSVKVWERGKKFFAKISSICARYATKGNLVSHIFEIERNGKANDQQTTYEIYETGEDTVAMEDLPDVPVVLGNIVLEKSADDMEYFLESGNFPPEDGEQPVRRRNSSGGGQIRRTPANNRDRF